MRMRRAARATCLCLGLAVALAGCGRRSALEAPPNAAAATERAAPATQEGRYSLSGPSRKATAPASTGPDRPFILDPLL